MELKALVIGQFLLDLIILGILFLIGRFYLNRKAMAADFQSTMEKSIALIKEMELLGKSFQGILEEKRKLTNRLIADLDTRLHKAELIRDEIKKVTDISTGSHDGIQEGRYKMAEARSLAEKLLAKGMAREEVAKYLGVPTGELDLIIKLKAGPQSDPKGPREK